MHNTTNDEKLKILQERLAQIKQKKGSPTSENPQRREVSDVSAPKTEESRENKEPSWGLEEEKKKSHTIKYFILLICVGLGAFAVYKKYIDKSTPTGPDSGVVAEEETPFILKYNFEISGNQLAIINSFKDESSAKAMVNNLIVKGFKCNYFFLPNKSNSTEEVFQVYIGPFENEKETSQWVQNIEKEVTIINLFDGTVLGNMKSNKLKAREKAEKEKIAREEAKKEKLAIEEAEKEKMDIEEAEKEKMAIEKAEQEKMAIEKAEQEKLQLVQEEEEEENEKLKKEIEKLEKERRILLSTRGNAEIKISYTYNWLSNIAEDEGVLTISNNAGYPNIEIAYANVKSQGGKIEIIKKVTAYMDNNGVSLNDIYFSNTGTLVHFYTGELSTVIW